MRLYFAQKSNPMTPNTYTFDISTDTDWQIFDNVQDQWQTPDTPFMQFAFWQALADSQAIGEKVGWLPMYILIKQNARLKAVLPIFIKDHHQGEYVFDHAWADAYYRYGADYYPRLVTSVPFTPVTGERFWRVKGQALNPQIWETAQTAIKILAEQIKASSWHGLFFDKTSVNLAKNPLLLERYGCQFLWQNLAKNGEKFTTFDDFLSILTAKKRKSIRVERQKVDKQGLSSHIKLGNQITCEDWEIFYQCYAMTYLVRGRQPYLSPQFFRQIGQSMTENIMLAQALDSTGQIVACALFFYDNKTLYGRYWGCLAEYDSLHFELCYYQGIEFAIAQGLANFDPGTQGEHKLIRGFMPILSYSLHQIYDKKFAPAIADFCKQERIGVSAYYEEAKTALPFNQDYQDFLQNHFDSKNNDKN